MSLRWRKDGELLCGAKSAPEPGDCYIDDRLHYHLSVDLGVVKPTKDERASGRWRWCEADAKRWALGVSEAQR